MSNDMIIAADLPLEQFRRPVIVIKGANALIDTGATIPMFYFPVKALEKAFGGVQLIYNDAHVGGIGNGRVDGKIYALQNFFLGNLHYRDMHVFVPDQFYKTDEMGKRIFERHPMLLSATMFEGLDYEFHMASQRFIIRIPEDMGYEMDFKIMKNQSGNLVPVINGVFAQEEAVAGIQY